MPSAFFPKRQLHILCLLFFTLVIIGCTGGTEIGNPQSGLFSAESGVAQKGPLQKGSLVTAQELDASLSPTGKQYTYQTDSDLGTFPANSNKYTSRFIDLYAIGYYFDEVTNAVSTGPMILNGISDLEEHSVLNLNLLTTLTYQRVKKLVTTQGLSLAVARAQAEDEVLAALNIPNGSRFGAFNSFDISGENDGDHILTAISSLFVYGNNAGTLSELISRFQFDIAEDGVIDDITLKASLSTSAQALDTAVVAANLSAKYTPKIFMAADIASWIDQVGDGVVGKFRFQVANASESSAFTLPAFAVRQLAGLPITVSAGQLSVNGSVASGAAIFNADDTISITPSSGTFTAGMLKIYLKSGTTNLSCITFSKELVSIAVTSEGSSIAVGLTKQFVATGTYADSTTADISNIVTWSSDNVVVATINATGLATGLANGTTTITAVSGAVQGSAVLTVTTAPWNTSTLFTNYIAVPVGSWPEAVAVGDINNDGRNDVVMTTSYYADADNDYKLFVFSQNASGGLNTPVKYATSCTYTNRPKTVFVGDINSDGRKDVVVGCSGSGMDVFLQNASGSLNPSTFYSSTDTNKIRIADLNHDGLLDIVGIGWGTNTASIWFQNVSGTLNSPVIYSVTHGGYDDLEVGDVNNDGLTDIVVMSGQSLLPNLGILTQKEDGTFNTPNYYSISNPVSASTLTHGVAVGDIDGDGFNDVVVSYGGNRPASQIGIFSQNVLGTLNPVVSYASYDNPGAAVIGDVNDDGLQDVIVLHGGWNAVGIYLQNTGGTMSSEELYTIPYASYYNPHGLAVADINGDGLKDIVIADYNHGLVILYHTPLSP